MAVPFYLPEGGHDDNASSSGGASSPSSDGTSTASSQSPNTTTSATQTPMQSPLLHSEQLVMAICEAIHRYSTSQIFQYPAPPSPSCSIHSPAYAGGGGSGGGELFFPRGRSTPRIPRTSHSFAAGEEVPYFHQHPPPTPQSAPPMPNYQSNYYHNASTNTVGLVGGYGPHYSHYQCTPPPTPTTTASPSTSAAMFNMSTSNPLTSSVSTSTTTVPMSNRLYRTSSDAARRSRLTSTGEDDREYHSEHETSWDEFDDRFENFSAGRERLQEFNGRIPPRKKKKEVPKPKEKKENSFTWPAVVTVLVFAMGCGFLVSR